MNIIKMIGCCICIILTIPIIGKVMEFCGEDPHRIFNSGFGVLIAITVGLFWYSVFEDK